MLVDVLCPHCKSKFSVDGTNIPPEGAEVDCERCGQKFTATLPKGQRPKLVEDLPASPRAGRRVPPQASRARKASTSGPPAAGAHAAPVAPPVAMPPVPVPGVGNLTCCPGCGLKFIVPQAAEDSEPAPSLPAPSPPAPAPPAPKPPSPTPAPPPPVTPVGAPGQITPVNAPRMAAPAPAAAPPKAAGRAKPTILVVEDLDFYTTLVSNALGAKYRTVAVDNVAAALNAMREEHVDLMVLDLTLKDGEDGRDVLRGLESKTCPILIFSAKDESEMYGATWQELRKLGADDMLIKGMNVQESLLQKIAGLLEKS